MPVDCWYLWAQLRLAAKLTMQQDKVSEASRITPQDIDSRRISIVTDLDIYGSRAVCIEHAWVDAILKRRWPRLNDTPNVREK